MDFETAMEGLQNAKERLQTREAITSLPILSEQMDRLATYTNAVEGFLAELERDLELEEASSYRKATTAGLTPSAAEKVARHEVADTKAEIKFLTRIVSSAWRLAGIKQSRYNHLEKEMKGQV